ncbi:defensin-like peptide family protein [Acinetobacter baumannii 233846]|nr:defensin-like peptide family protein [Acinetobacter baumannii 233846]
MYADVDRHAFLNGVCRHEQLVDTGFTTRYFLNGVCRHEPTFAITD